MKYGSPASQMMSWEDYLGQSQGSGSSPTLDYRSMAEDLLAKGDTRGAAELMGMEEQKGFNSQMLTRMDGMNQKPSAWATGTQAFGNVAQGLAGLGSIYLGMQGMKEQKKMNKFNMGMANTNMNNSILDYNRRLEGTLQNRALNNGGGQGYVSEQLARYSARRSG